MKRIHGIYIDNIKIVANYDAQDNVIYMIPKDGSTYYAYIYVDGQPILIGANDTAIPEQNYSSKPV
ncbi:MAG: hypothetical protein Q4G33_04755 [bacterium]|nr:hypothetical protein [bacterium]